MTVLHALHAWDIIDAFLVSGGIAIGWLVHALCWIRYVNTNLANLNIAMTLLLEHAGVEWTPQTGIKKASIKLA